MGCIQFFKSLAPNLSLILFNSAVLNSFLKISAKVQKEKESIEEDYRRPSVINFIRHNKTKY